MASDFRSCQIADLYSKYASHMYKDELLLNDRRLEVTDQVVEEMDITEE